VLALERAADGRRAVIAPDDLVEKTLAAEQAVQLYFDIVDGVPVEMDVQRAAVGQQVAAQRQPAGQPGQIGLELLVIAVRVDRLGGLLARALDARTISLARAERRVKIDELEPSRPLLRHGL